MGVPCCFCSRRRVLSVLWYQQKEMPFGIEMRDHGALPKPTPGTAPGWGSSAHGGKAKGETVAWGELHPGPHSPSPQDGSSAAGRLGASGSPHITARELLTRALPFPSLLGLLLRHRRVELLQSGGEHLPLSRTTDLGQVLWERAGTPSPCQAVTLPGHHLPGRGSCQDTLPRCCRGCRAAEKGPCIPLLPSRACTDTQTQAHRDTDTHRHKHTHLLQPVGCLPIQTAEACESFMKHRR